MNFNRTRDNGSTGSQPSGKHAGFISHMADVVSIGAGVTLVCDMTGVTFCTEDLTLVSGVYGTSINLGSGTGGLVLTSSGPSVTIIAGDLVMTTGPQGIQAQGGLLPFTFGF